MINTSLRLVDTFQRPAYFLAKDNHFYLLDVMQPGDPNVLFQFDEVGCTMVSPIAIDQDDKCAYITNGYTIFKVSCSGAAAAIATINQLLPTNILPPPQQRFPRNQETLLITYLEYSEDNLYYKIAGPRARLLGRFNIDSMQNVIFHPVHSDVFSIDARRELIYWFSKEKKTNAFVIRITDFYARTLEIRPITNFYTESHLSDDGELLLMSGIKDDNSPVIGIYHLSSQTETIICSNGRCAVWGPHKSVVFLSEENALCIFDMSERRVHNLLEIVIGRKEFVSRLFDNKFSPVVSRDKTWIACSLWTDQPALCIVLIDWIHAEYKVLSGVWPNYNWITCE